jgi:surface protein
MITLAGVGQGSVKNPLGANQFVSTWNPSLTSTGSSTATQVKLPLVSTGTYNFSVNWGDGTTDTITTWNQAQVTHTYSTSKLYQITITGTCYGWQFNAGGDRLKLLSVQQWGNAFRLGNATGYFSGCENLELQQVADVLDLTGTTTFLNMFSSCLKLTTVRNINSWVTTNVTIMSNAFINALNFDDNIGAWDVSNVTSLSGMFNITTTTKGVFNNGGSNTIKNWNTSKNTSLVTTFQGQKLFDQEIGTWDVSKVTSLNGLFNMSSTNRGIFNNGGSASIGNWNTGLVTNMAQVFSNQLLFNQNIGSWNTANVTTFEFMFNCGTADGIFNNAGSDTIKNWNTAKVTNMRQVFTGQPLFNQPIGLWNTALVTRIDYMFYSYASPSTPTRLNGSFNKDISAWNTANVTNMAGIFASQVLFNQPLDSWNVAKVTSLESTFYKAIAFNQPLNSWNTVLTTSMANTFFNATAFNQSISNWKANIVTTFGTVGVDGFMGNKTNLDYSSANYDALLIGWASRPVLANKTINFGTIKYTSASVSARAVLTSAPNNWTIIDGGLV